MSVRGLFQGQVQGQDPSLFLGLAVGLVQVSSTSASRSVSMLGSLSGP